MIFGRVLTGPGRPGARRSRSPCPPRGGPRSTSPRANDGFLVQGVVALGSTPRRARSSSRPPCSARPTAPAPGAGSDARRAGRATLPRPRRSRPARRGGAGRGRRPRGRLRSVPVATVDPGDLGARVRGQVDAVLVAGDLDHHPVADGGRRLLEHPGQRGQGGAVGHEHLPGQVGRGVVHAGRQVEADHGTRSRRPCPGGDHAVVVQHEVDRHLAGVAVVASDRVGAQQVHVDRAVVEDAVDDRGQHGLGPAGGGHHDAEVLVG